MSINYRYCYWSIGDGNHAKMLESAVYSARQVGIEENIHVWSDRIIPTTIPHDIGNPNKDHYLFKLHILNQHVSNLRYDYYIFFDADTWFVRNPGEILNYVYDDPLHVTLESDCTNPVALREDWWGCPLPDYVRMMRECGVKDRIIYNCNAGLFIIHRKAVKSFYRLCMEFWNYAKERGYTFTEEAPMAYAAQIMMGNPYLHTMYQTTELWASDWNGNFKDRLPVEETWDFYDYMTNIPIKVNPAIVHAMRSKDELVFLDPWNNAK